MPRLRPWLIVAAWAALMSGFSTDTFSSEHSSRILLPVLRWLLPHASEDTLELLHLFIRKCAHFVEYFILGLLLLRAVRAPEHGWKLRWAAVALLIAAAYSGLDEFHQSFVPSRTASGWDSLLDTMGAAMAQIAAWLVVKRDHRRSDGGTTAPRVP